MLPEQDLKIITQKMGREPNLVEQGCFINLWSEHCSYRSSAPLLRTFTTSGNNVIIGPGDDAAIVRFDDERVIAIGMESHNHPSYVDPYNGAATGVGGIVRDIVSMGARPIALMDPLYFGTLDIPKNLYLFEHIIEGIAGYGNCIGVPVVRGEAFFDESYSGNPLVNVVCIGLANKDNVVTADAKEAGNKLVLVGAATGRDGLGGASFASRDLSHDAEASERPSIQIGDPYTEKLLIEATLECINKGYVAACRDLGAAGLAGASSEMGSKGDLGIYIIADNVIQRESNMTPYEILIAESQERMLMEVKPENVDRVLEIADKYDLNSSVIGEITSDEKYKVEFEGKVVADIPIKLLTEGAPTFERPAQKPEIRDEGDRPEIPEDLKKIILEIVSSHTMASKQWIYRQYDHEVQIRTLVKPGDDASVLNIGEKGLVLSCGCNPIHTLLDPYRGGLGTVVENAMNIAVKGAKGLAIVDCLNFGNPEKPEIYWQFKQAILGLGDAARMLSIPVVGGNVSLYNQSEEYNTSVAPTPSIGIVGITENVDSLPGSGFNAPGDSIILIGETADEMGGCEYYRLLDIKDRGRVPSVPENINDIIEGIIEIVQKDSISSSHDISSGGLAVALCEMCSHMGASIELDNINQAIRLDEILFSESHGRAIVTSSRPETVTEILESKGIPCTIIGTVGGDCLNIMHKNTTIRLALDEITDARNSLTKLMTQ
ncbi:phosphoribosylformylglycinamidine synthase II [Methanosalsum zhilinae DSM 4017]|uniref:Phosphoribosylformylglycinamidine synthase subunit PurL n=1 Tax=Methanosalsum zhilinae (strain DSM 4017 / NBRC 107636 / OCM 62 / WeN5) TaxID=679901 RepID=F7XKC9_METZD|nr:phosphoribosylformylglycinamidine synthase subunit PurL [Methanosalsum zhilinae]AEH61697.1 phosphoribosylformylglycinamidine synthase II [Methanosalsum zhilinae DSM 4017]